MSFRASGTGEVTGQNRLLFIRIVKNQFSPSQFSLYTAVEAIDVAYLNDKETMYLKKVPATCERATVSASLALHEHSSIAYKIKKVV